jgi:hypothetical protein
MRVHGISTRPVVLNIRTRLGVLIVVTASMLPLAPDRTTAAGPIPIYVFAGQSNMVGSATRASDIPLYAPGLSVPPSTNVLFWGPTTDAPKRWTPIQPPTVIRDSMFRSGFGPELSAAHRLKALHPGRQIGIFKFARSNTSLYKAWDPDNPIGLYRQMHGALSYARNQLTRQTKRSTYIAGFFWMQGESDAYKYSTAVAYGKNLEEFIFALRYHLKTPKLPVVVARIADLRYVWPSLKYTHYVRREQFEVAAADHRTFLVYTEGLPREVLSPVHFNAKGTIELGRRFVQSKFGL